MKNGHDGHVSHVVMMMRMLLIMMMRSDEEDVGCGDDDPSDK